MIKVVLKSVYMNSIAFRNNKSDRKRISDLQGTNSIKLYWCEDGCNFRVGPDKQIYSSIRYGTRDDIKDLMIYFGNNKLGDNLLSYNFNILDFFNQNKSIGQIRKAIGRKSGRKTTRKNEYKKLEKSFSDMLGDFLFIIFRSKEELYKEKDWVFDISKKLVSEIEAKTEEDVENWIKIRFGTWTIERYQEYIERRDNLWLDPDFISFSKRVDSERSESGKLRVTLTSPFLKTTEQKEAGILYLPWQLRWYYIMAGPNICKELRYTPKKISDRIDEIYGE